MVAEIGLFALILAILTAFVQGVFPLIGASRGDTALMRLAQPAALVQFVLIALAFGCLTFAHATSDFSILNVVENSHTSKPFAYKISGVWGNHEGSMLLWVLILAGFGAMLAGIKPRSLATLRVRAIAIQGIVATAFLSFIVFTSNPFARMFPAPADGMDLNPLLQDPGLAIHPPFLYLGYVGFSVTFAYAIAGLLEGRIDSDWARAVRPWALVAWVFLTIGIALGSWWAYYELGWGGFWAWDPVENASFMPWLAGTAFLHSVRVLEKRDALKVLTVFLAILAFSLSLIGTFLVRSGILTSVHAFAVDPARGVFILIILAATIGGSLMLFALRAPSLTSSTSFAPVSREGAIVFNNVLLVAACATVFVGTFYPLFVDITSGERISVGAPYFNATFLPLMAISLLILAPAATLAWKRGRLSLAMSRLWPALVVAGAVFLLAAWMNWPKPIAAAFGAGLAAWAGVGAIADLLVRIKAFGSPISDSWRRFMGLPLSYTGMTIAHTGLAIVALGVIGAGVWRSEDIKYLQTGDKIFAGAYEAVLTDVREGRGPNYVSEMAVFRIEKNGKFLREMASERRFYPIRGMQTTEAGIWTTIAGDLYLTLGESSSNQGWAVRAYFNPFVLWLWIGSGLMALGGIVAASDAPRLLERRRKLNQSAATLAVEA